MTEWFRRKSDKIKTFDKRDTQRGQWQKCPSCSEVLYYKSLESNNFICTICTYHFRISSLDYFKLLLEPSDIVELGNDISSLDHLEFEGVKKYSDQIEQAKSKKCYTSLIQADLTKKILGTKGIKKIKKNIPLRRLASKEEIANLIIFLSSSYSNYITGQNIIIDGGYTSQ